MKIIFDRFNATLAIGGVDKDDYPSVSVWSSDITPYLDAEQVEELIEALQDRLKEMKG